MSDHNFESSYSVSSSDFKSNSNTDKEDKTKKNDKLSIYKESISEIAPLIYFLCVIIGLIYIVFF